MKIVVRLLKWILITYLVRKLTTYVVARYVLTWVARNKPVSFNQAMKTAAAKQGVSEIQFYRRLCRAGYRGPAPSNFRTSGVRTKF